MRDRPIRPVGAIAGGIPGATAGDFPGGIWSAPLRATTAGIVLAVTLVAFEAMAVATAMPRAVADLRGLAWYAWPFTAFLVANIAGMVGGGDLSDRYGPRRAVLAGLGLFAVGLLCAGAAPVMAAFVLGRAVQGLGSGLVIVALYVVIAEVFPDALRPRVFAALSAAWVLPALVGPVVAGLVTEHLSWRLVFLALIPLLGGGLLLLRPALSGLPGRRPDVARTTRWPAALSAGIGLAAVQYAGQRPTVLSLVPLVGGLLLLVVGLRRLLPPGTVRLAAGLPAVIGIRGLAAGAFFAVDSFLPLTLTQLHGYRPAAAGLPLTAGALGWAAGSWWQGRSAGVSRRALLRAGLALVAGAAAGVAALAAPAVPGWTAYPLWAVGGAGMGLVMSSVGVLLLRLSPPADRGRNSSALQIADVVTSALCIGAGGVLVAAAEAGRIGLPTAVGALAAAMAVVAAIGALAAGRAAAGRPAVRPPAGSAARG